MVIVILFLLGMAAYYQTKANISDRYSVNIFMGVAASIIIAVVLLVNFLKNRSQRMTTISRWLEILIIPMALSLTWEGLFGILLNRTGAKPILTIIFGLVLLVLYLPIAVVDVGQIKNAVGGMTAQTWRGDANDWLNLLVQVVVPIAITIWMLTGQRRLVMEQNIMRLLEN